MFSPLTRGYGTWTGEITLKNENNVIQLPNVVKDGNETHRHGITITPRINRSNTNYSLASHKDDGEVNLPKTYLTRKGALLLFAAPPGDPETTKHTKKLLHRKKVENLLDISLKLNTLERLYLSALQYGDLTGYSSDKGSITDPDSRWFLKFLHGLDEQDVDISTKPGGDLNFYLRDLKSRASSRVHGTSDSSTRRQRSQELQDLLHDLEGVWRSKSQNSLKPESTNLSRSLSSPNQRILSSKSLAASIKSSTYLGRADSTGTNFSTVDDAASLGGSSVVLPQITTKHVKRMKASWVSPITGKDDVQAVSKQQPVAVTMVSTGKRMASATGSRNSANSKSSRLSGSGNSLDDKHSSSGSSKQYDADVRVNALVDDDSLDNEATGFDNETTGLDEDVWTFGNTFKTGVEEAVIDANEDLDNNLGNVHLGDADNLVEGLADDSPVIGVGDVNITYDGHLDDKEGQENKLSVDISDQKMDDSNNMGTAATKGNLDEHGGNASNFEKASVSSSVLEEQDIVLLSDGEETIDFAEQPEEWPGNSDEFSTQLQQQEEKEVTDPNDETENNLQNGPQKTDSDDKNDKESRNSSKNNTFDGEDKSVHVPRPPSEAGSSEGRRSKLNGRSSRLSDASAGDAKYKDLNGGDEAIEVVPSSGKGDKESVPQEADDKESVPQEADDNGDQISVNQHDDNESEKSLSFVYINDNSTSASASVGKHEPEEDIADMIDRRRRERLLSNLKMENISSLEEVEDDFAERVKEAEKAEQDFMFIREEYSDEESGDTNSEPETLVRKHKTKKPVKKPTGEKVFVQALEITSIAPIKEELVDEEVTEEDNEDKPWIHPNQRFFPEGPLPKFEVPEDEVALPSHLEEMLTRRSASKSAEELENELLQMQEIMNKDMADTSMAVDEGEAGLTEEELKLAQELLEERVKEVSAKIFNTGEEQVEEEIKSVKKPSAKSKKGGKVKKKPKIVEPVVVDRKQSIAVERDSIRQQRKLEKLRKLEEMRALQEKISEKEELRKAQEEERERRAKELAEEQRDLENEAADIKRSEEIAREQLAEVRRAQREERETRRKVEQERKRQLAISKREREKKMREIGRIKEQEMLDRLGDAETRRELREEEDMREEEEDRIAQETFEEEMREQQIASEEEEIRIRELEKEAEEEAMQRLIEEREKAERRQRQLKEEEEKIRKEEELQRRTILVEEERLREEKRLKEAEEQSKLEEERKRLDELKRLEAEAREIMNLELKYKREWAIKRRDHNLDRRAHLDKIRIGQGFTKPWVFSYFVLWNKDSFSKLMGKDPKNRTGFQFKPKSRVSVPPPAGSPEPEFMPGLSAIAEE